ncbi:response regulator [Uliginosibacterium sp. H3]|uniref:Response regulator n=1 Tax=Uliginosibacterium silvisoli TaxID=3114758 RepID=A0ABU6K7N5_9RHOO|nr:response regulator [Uliginosibacterium sp. H3]
MALHSALSCHSPSDAHAASPLEGLRVLVVDDSRETRESLAALLGLRGVKVTLADSGIAALNIVTDLAPDYLPEVLICDIAMPDQDGYVTLSRIREWEARNDARAPMPAIAFTASALQHEKLKAASYGFNAHLTKPIVPDRLYSALKDMSRLRSVLTI